MNSRPNIASSPAYTSAYSENTPKVFNVCGEYVESIEAYMTNTTKLGLFAVHKILSKQAENIYTYSENAQKILSAFGHFS